MHEQKKNATEPKQEQKNKRKSKHENKTSEDETMTPEVYSRHTRKKTKCRNKLLRVSSNVFSLHPSHYKSALSIHSFTQPVEDLRFNTPHTPEAVRTRKHPGPQHSAHHGRALEEAAKTRRGSPPRPPLRRRLRDALLDSFDTLANCSIASGTYIVIRSKCGV